MLVYNVIMIWHFFGMCIGIELFNELKDFVDWIFIGMFIGMWIVIGIWDLCGKFVVLNVNTNWKQYVDYWIYMVYWIWIKNFLVSILSPCQIFLCLTMINGNPHMKIIPIWQDKSMIPKHSRTFTSYDANKFVSVVTLNRYE